MNKPLGPIPAGFSARDGELVIGEKSASALAARAGQTPLFVYSRAMIEERIAALRAILPRAIGINYAVKANPLPALLDAMTPLVDGFDIASSGELALCMDRGIDPQRISFAGPGKRDDELEAAIAAGITLNCESEGEAARALAIAKRLGRPLNIAIRVNPDFELKGSGMKMGGGAKPFGIDAERVPELIADCLEKGANWRGLHIFTGSQTLSAEAILEVQQNVVALAGDICAQVGRDCPALNLGGGFGVPYFPGDEPVDLAMVGEGLASIHESRPAPLRDSRMCLELGRYLVGEAGVYLTRIVDKKVSHGTTYLVTDGGLHHQLAASGNFGTVVRRNYPVAIATRFDAKPSETVNVIGCLCTPLDRLADQALLPEAQVGDLVAVFCAGAYGASASPSAFLGHGPAPEILI